jgi:cobalt/nickel transport system permease protein
VHIPDGFLDPKTWGTLYGASGGMVGYALYKVRKLDEKKIPLLGITAAFIFAAQLLNFPIAGGTSGHFLGALLACVLLGPFEGFLVMVVVLAVQCLVFADGGFAALGANIFNMGIIAGIASYYLMMGMKSVLSRRVGEKRALLTSAAAFSWISVVLAATCCSIELAISGTIPLTISLPAMVSVYMIVGVGEAVITVLVLATVLQARPDLVFAYKGKAVNAGAIAEEAA